MSDLLTDFVAEARDLLEQSSQSLLALESTPDDQALLNELYRFIHTIKGGAGLFKAQPLIAVVHACEDLLDALRERQLVLTPEIVDLLFSAMDQVSTWLDDLQRDGEVGDAASEPSAALEATIRAFIPECEEEEEEDDVPPDADAPFDWVEKIAAQAEIRPGEGVWAIEYTPHEDCFFGGEDPLLTALETPGRVGIEILPREPWPDDRFDPILCNLKFHILSTSERDALEEHFLYVRTACRFARVAEEPSAAPARGQMTEPMVEAALSLLAMQRDSIAALGEAELWRGRVAACATLLERVLQNCGLHDEIEALAEAQRDALASEGPDPLEALIERLMSRLQSPESVGEDPDENPASAAPTAPPPNSPSAAESEASRKQLAIKVDQEHIDALMKRVGELVVAKNALPFLIKRAEEVHGNRPMAREIKAEYEAINRIVDEIQTAVMQIRMVPVGQVFQRYHRLVRDVSRKLDKSIHLQIEGEDTKADKNIVEALNDPLVHLVRNACDHGLETPSERRSQGKPEKGVICLSAQQVDDQVVIEVRDDGRGVNVEQVKRKAVEKGLISPEAAEAMSDEEAAHLILAPGFSTADQISDLSGRGVGMDVVNTMVKSSGGSMRVVSDPGKGTSISISLPLSMAVSQVMSFDVGKTLYGVSIEKIVETVRIPASSIHSLKKTENVVLRDRLVPLVRLRDRFGLKRLEENENDEISVLIVRAGGEEVGLVVDRVHSETDVLIEPLDEILNTQRYFSGSALLGDGTIMLVVDAEELL